MARSTSSRGSSSRTAFRLTYETPALDSEERPIEGEWHQCVRIYWSKKALVRKVRTLPRYGARLISVEVASVRWRKPDKPIVVGGDS